MCVPKMIQFLILCIIFHTSLAKLCTSDDCMQEAVMYDKMWMEEPLEKPRDNRVLEELNAEDEALQETLSDEPDTETRHTTCSCRTAYGIKDLGEGYYPRLITEARCQDTECRERKFHPCRMVNYTIHVLQKRAAATIVSTEPNLHYLEDQPPEALLPEALENDWKLVPMTVQTGCTPDFERNI